MSTQLLGNPAASYAGLGLRKAKSTYPRIELPPWINAPAAAEPFAFNNAISLSGSGAVKGSTLTIISFTVPANRSGVIWRVANGTAVGGGISGWINGSGSLVWQIVRNGVPFKNFNNIVALLGTVENGGAPLSGPLHVRANDNIALVVNNVSIDPQGQNLLGLLSGYYYPASSDPSTLR